MRKPAAIRLIVATGLFLGWIGYLSYLALTVSRPIVLSRPQFLVPDILVVIAQVDSPTEPVEVLEVIPADHKHAPKTKQIRVSHLNEWKKAGRYILPLLPEGADEYSVVPIPSGRGVEAAGERRIYPLTDETRAQLKQVFR